MMHWEGGHSNSGELEGEKMAAPRGQQPEVDQSRVAESGPESRPELCGGAPAVAVTVALAAPPVAPGAGGAYSVSVAFPGSVTREGCFRFTCELLKHVLYQRQQLPLPYEQLACFCRSQLPRPPRQDEDVVRKVYPRDPDNNYKKCQQVLSDLEGVFQHLEIMFSLTLIPRVLIMLGGTAVSPKELYEINLQGISVSGAEESLQTSACVRKLFHSLFLADVFSELQAVPTMGMIVMAQGHRNCGIDWFRPKLNYKVPARGRKLTVNLSCNDGNRAALSAYQEVNSAWDDYIWFQAPVTVKGFRFFS
ncbi:MAD2L1-binding protein [Hemicordylus capensis]|uniref:MAD2L1-binding protein n=1 Tax=Hemicordylus capensis TaxID=884348 RepID=UPI0023044469|nr:MAD2L1-binding protein [Hemicordylus capensis]